MKRDKESDSLTYLNVRRSKQDSHFFFDLLKFSGSFSMEGNAFAEFWPDVKKIMFKKKPASPQPAAGRAAGRRPH